MMTTFLRDNRLYSDERQALEALRRYFNLSDERNYKNMMKAVRAYVRAEHKRDDEVKQ